MAIPDYIHPFKLLLACVGIDPQRQRPPPAVVLQLISNALELPPIQATQLMTDLRSHLAPVADELTRSSEFFLRIEERVENLTSKLGASVDRLGRQAAKNLSESFDDWLMATLRVDPDTFGQLLYYAIGHFHAACYKRGTRPLALDELDRFCDALITTAPEAFRAAHAALIAETSTPRTPAVLQRQQASLHPLHHLMQSERHEASGEQHSALLDRLQAWADAAETTIYAVTKFVWTLRGYPASLTDEVPGKSKPQKGNVFNLAAEWCDRYSVPFPFRRDLYKLRNSFAHKHIAIDPSGVTFNDDEGIPIATLSHDAAAEVIEHDIIIASHFAGVLTAAESRHHNRLGKFDEAWASAKSFIPGLELMALDADAIWPTHARLARLQYRRVATFGTVPISGGRGDRAGGVP